MLKLFTSSRLLRAAAASGGVAFCQASGEFQPAAQAASSSSSSSAAPLRGRRDPYEGLAVDSASLPQDAPAFRERMSKSLKAWQDEGVRGVWLKLPIDSAHLVPEAVALGFKYHHAEPDYAMLTNWLSTTIENHLPPNASHQIGVGAWVVNEKGKLLVVQENIGILKGKGVWKIPTGLVNAGEDFSEAAVRECLEETGINANFESVMAFRHAHGFLAGKSDLFFVCLLRVKDSSRQHFKLQETEIEKARWMDIETFLQQAPYPRDMPLWARLYNLANEISKGGPGAAPFVAERHAIGYRPGDNDLFHAGVRSRE